MHAQRHAPMIGNTTGSFDYDADAGTLTINGLGRMYASKRLARSSQHGRHARVGDLRCRTVGDSMTVTVEAGAESSGLSLERLSSEP